MNLAPFQRLILGTAITALSTSCTQHSGVACPQFEYISPQVQQLYPIPGASAVPAAFGVLVYTSTQPVPISLSTSSTIVPTRPTVVPSPLPSPAATPILLPGRGTYAVAVPPLAAQTTYGAVAAETLISGCSPPKAAPERIGTFMTL